MGSELLAITRLFGAAPPPFRLVGPRITLRTPEREDFDDWANLRAESRGFLAPFEPSWPSDAVTRAGFRRRLQRYAADWRSDQGYSFLLIRRTDRVLLGGISLSGGRGSLLGTLGGVLLLGVVANMFNILQVDSFFQQLILGLVVLVTVATYRTRKAT